MGDVIEILPAGDAAALVVMGDEMSIDLSMKVHALAGAVAGSGLTGIMDLAPSYCTLLIHFDPLHLSFEQIRGLVEKKLASGVEASAAESRLRELPTVYGGAYGPDLPAVAQRLGLPEQEIIRLHSGATYVVCTLGFAPGQPYVIGLPPQLAMPRREKPVERVPIGAVVIANQTTFYPMANPTGWWWIGRTPVRLFDPTADPPTYLQPGDRIRCTPISEAEYLRLGGEKAE